MTQNRISSPLYPAVRPHDRFYLEDDFVTLEVGCTTLFRLPAFILKNHSRKFKDLIEGEPTEKVELDFSAKDFERFLLVLFPTQIGEYSISSLDEWVSVLKIASELECPAIKKLAVAQLEVVASPIDRIVVGRKHYVRTLVASGYVELCQREAPITLLEGNTLGMSDVIEISNIHRHLQSAGGDVKITRESVLEICSVPRSQVLKNNAVADFIGSTALLERANPPASLPDPGVSPLVSASPSLAGILGQSPHHKSYNGSDTTAPILQVAPQSRPRKKRKIRSHKTLVKAAWVVKFGSKIRFQAFWKETTPEYRQLWNAEWSKHAKFMNNKEADEFIRAPRIQAMIPCPGHNSQA
ncbi:hypothetical protein BDN72DRAFT_851795 [Pluteus cervinus]|uniref:Uncharacterized protein n=1 Tax=Pluteus cervinus TaxID=181527 RepID=A0ACD2ZYP9_9AGAR|nr:hypothetical protein BDN72DRAFT_851795 [Pluteus cervinus]